MRITFDSNVYVSALNYSGIPSQLLELAALESFRLQLSAEILDETIRILKTKFAWPDEHILETRAVLFSISDRVVPHVRLEVVQRDPDDNRILECSQKEPALNRRRVRRVRKHWVPPERHSINERGLLLRRYSR